MDKGNEVSLSNDQENANEINDDEIEGGYLNDITIKEIITINKNYLDDLEPSFKNSIEDFIKVLNNHLNDVQVSNDQKKLLEKQIEGLALEIINIPAYKKIQNDILSSSTQSICRNNDDSIEIDSNDADAYYKKGLSLSTVEKYAEAIECYDKALEINPQNADAYYKKGLSLYYLGNNDEAIECYDTALEINPPIRTSI